MAPRLGDRGGAMTDLLSVLDGLAERCDQTLAVEAIDPKLEEPCPIVTAPGLLSLQRAPVSLDPLIDDLAPDVVHIHNVMNPEVLEWGARRGAVLTLQDHRAFCPGRGKWTTDRRACADTLSEEVCSACFDDASYRDEIYSLTRERLAAALGMPITVLSAYMKRELVAAGAASERVSIVPPFVYGLDTYADPEPGAPCALFVGRLVEAKGVFDAVDAWRASGVDAPLVFAGTGPLRADLESRGFDVRGWLGREGLAALYRRAAVVLMPSRWQEPFGIVGIESLACGTPVVGYRSGGIPEWLDERGLVGWGDVDAMAGMLRRFEDLPASPRRSFDREATIDALLDVYARAGAASRGW